MQGTKMEFMVSLRDQLVTVVGFAYPPDRSVGIMGTQFEEQEIRDEEGNILDWELTDEESDVVCERADDLCNDVGPVEGDFRSDRRSVDDLFDDRYYFEEF